MRSITLCLLLWITMPASALFAQTQNSFRIVTSGNYEKSTLYDILTGLESQYSVRVCLDPDKIPWYRLDFRFTDKTLHETLTELLTPNGLVYAVFNDSMVGVCRKPDLNAAYMRELRQRCLENNIEQPDFLSPFEQSAVIGTPGTADKPVDLKILVADADNGEPVVGAVVQAGGTNNSSPTDPLGQTTLHLGSSRHLLTVEYPGYRRSILTLDIWQSGQVKIGMKSTPEVLQEVQISGNVAENKVKNAQTAVEALPTRVIRELPAFMGEADVVKSLSVLAGVSSAGEGSSGFNVRGGNVDQNLALLDGTPLFNTAHVLGLFSVYNPDLVQNVTLYKGFVPARYGGRVASVLDVRLKDGNFESYHGNVGIGIATGKVRLEGPLWKNRVSFLAGYRQSYADWMVQRLRIPEARYSSARFSDAVLKISARLGERSSLSLSGFRTGDYFQYGQQFGYSWGNQALNLQWRHPLGSRMVSVWQASAGQYRGNYFIPDGQNAFDLKNGLGYQNIHWRVNYPGFVLGDLHFGAHWERLRGLNERLRPRGEQSAVNTIDVPRSRGETIALFVENEREFGQRWLISAGLRGVFYRQTGPQTEYLYAPDAPRRAGSIIDSVLYSSGKTLYTHWGLEPRLSVKYQLNAQNALKLSYNRMHQYVHQISNLSAPTPADIWQVSNRYILPQASDQIDLGFARDWNEREYEFSADIFFKNTRNTPVYRNSASLLLNPHLETELSGGILRNIGFEAGIQRKTGRVSGWLNYTFSRALLRTTSPWASDAVNRGEWFASDFDQPHQINALLKLEATPTVLFSFNYIYRTGRPVTAPQAVYQVGNVVVPDYTERNNLRVPDYHRLDFSMNIDQNKSRISGIKTTFNLSLYNVFGRNNPYTVYFKKTSTGPPRAYSLSLVGALIPSVNMIFTF